MSFASLGTPPADYTPYPPWSVGLVAVVEQAIREAWRILVRDHAAVLHSHDEDRITDKLITVLVELRAKQHLAGFNAYLFGVPVRDAKLPDWRGQSIDKTPDITIYPAIPREGVSDGRHDALFMECKVLHDRRRLTQYCKDGIQRFLDGRYAWRMPHAHMVAYAFACKDINPLSALSAHFASSVSGLTCTVGDTMGNRSSPSVVLQAGCNRTPAIVESVHARIAPPLVDRENLIALRHVWLCDPP